MRMPSLDNASSATMRVVQQSRLITPGRLAALALAWLVVILAVAGVWRVARNSVLEEVRSKARDTAAFLASSLDAGQLSGIRRPEDTSTTAFQAIWAILKRAEQTYPDVRYVYTLRPNPARGPDSWEFIVDAQPFAEDLNGNGVIDADEQPALPGTLYDGSDIPALKEALARPSAARDFYTDPWGTLISGYAPVRDAVTSETVAVLGVDVTRASVLAKFRLVDLAAAGSLAVLLAAITAAMLALFGKSQALDLIQQLDERVREKNEQLVAAVAQLRERERIMEQELALARDVQAHLLPSAFPFPDELRFATAYRACSMIGGDLFDVFPVTNHAVAFYIADVSGHGVSAALITAIFKAGADSCRERVASAAREAPGGWLPESASQREPLVVAFMDEMNRCMVEAARPGTFITCLFGLMGLDDGVMSLANAGHTRPIVYRAAEGEAEELRVPSNIALGIMPGFEFEVMHARLHRGDKLLLYTDGISERRNADGLEFGRESLMAVVETLGREDAEGLAAGVMAAADSFGSTVEAHDDQSLLVMEYLERPAPAV
ncbi:MAG: SpoIIE family protein phosphatase [Candidatus Sumerlaeaceae bacterium]|nr:SpoIIE family protein phosphatase [Candidatus Sumerlaeaceae bacterium]